MTDTPVITWVRQKDYIKQFLDCCEQSEDIQILYACESGSRVYRFDSKDSDYDVRFVYLRPMDSYLSLSEHSDTITVKDGDIDAHGWDLQKFLNLMKKSNVSVFEWLNSPLKYKEDETFEEVEDIAHNYFNPLSCYYHYFNQARSLFDTELKKQYQEDRLCVKTLLYVLRGLFSAEWCMYNLSMPTLDFNILSSYLCPVFLQDDLKVVLDKKKDGDELCCFSDGDDWMIYLLHKFTSISEMEPVFKYYMAYHKPIGTMSLLDDTFIEVLKENNVVKTSKDEEWCY